MKQTKILIADDEPMIREGLSDIIKSFDLSLALVGEAKNGLEALRLSQTLDPDIILTDICMPKLSGLRFIEKLREETKECKIIIISGFNEFEYARQAISLGVSEYLLKPVNEEELRKTILSCIRPKKTEEETEEEGDSLTESCLRIMKKEYTNCDFDLGALSKRLFVNPDYLSRKLKSETGLSFKEWLTKLRIRRSLELLESGCYTISEIAEMTGYSNRHYFSTAFKHYTGYSPKRHREAQYEKKN